MFFRPQIELPQLTAISLRQFGRKFLKIVLKGLLSVSTAQLVTVFSKCINKRAAFLFLMGRIKKFAQVHTKVDAMFSMSLCFGHRRNDQIETSQTYFSLNYYRNLGNRKQKNMQNADFLIGQILSQKI